MKAPILFVFALLMLTSCAHIGPVELKPDRLNYNASLQYSDMQQQLLNIVRLRYSDPPYFLSVNSIVSQFNLTRKGSVSVGNDPEVQPLRVIGKGSAEASFSDMPTVTYTPLQGTEFIIKLMTPIDIRIVYMLLRAGWGFNHTLRPLVQRFGPLDNAHIASRVTSSRIPDTRAFMEVGLIFHKLQQQSAITFNKDEVDNAFAIRVDIEHFSRLNQRERHALRRIGVTEASPRFWMVSKPSDAPNEIHIETRTILGVLSYFSKGVDVPLEDIKCKQVPMTYYKNGKPFDWHQVTQGLFEVRVSNKKPCDAFVSVEYRKKWFYISESDFESKETLNLIMMLMGIYQGKVEGFLPVFTVS